MRIRTFAAATTVALVAALPLAGTAFAADRDCADFASQADAQAALQPGDPERLDRDDDGQACENHRYAAAASGSSGSAGSSDGDQVTVKPAGGVETGGGPDSTLSTGLTVALGAAAAGGVGAVAVRRFARR